MPLFNEKKDSKARRVSRPQERIKPSYFSGARQPASASPFQKRPAKSRTARRPLTSLKNLLILAFIGVGIIFCLIINPKPHTVVSSSAYHPASAYEAAVTKAFTSPRNRTKLTLDRAGLGRALKKQFPEIDNLEIDVPIFSQIPTVHLGIAVPTFSFASGGKSYIVGSNGVVVGLSSQLAIASKLPDVIDQSGFEAAPGKQVLGTEAVAFINSLLSQSVRGGVKVTSLTLPPAASELDLRAQNQPYYVKFYLDGDVTLQAGQYLAAKHKFDSEHTQPDQYLDVRVAGKVYYK